MDFPQANQDRPGARLGGPPGQFSDYSTILWPGLGLGLDQIIIAHQVSSSEVTSFRICNAYSQMQLYSAHNSR
jgi:hypothetical protein